MRFRIILLVLVAGCATPEQRAQQAFAEEKYAAARRGYEASPTGQAERTCETKVAFAMAGNPIRGSFDVAGVVRQQQLQAACLDHWRRTGQFP